MVTPDRASLTARQQQVLQFVEQHLGDHGYPPTVREIGAQLGLGSPSTVHAHLAALERAGFLRRDPTKPRALTVAELPRSATGADESAGPDTQAIVESAVVAPVVGDVAAGQPLLAEQNIEEYVPLPQSLTRSGTSFVLRVRGDSMIEAGILDGDYVVVRRQQTADDGQIVVALVDDEATCKTLRRRDGRIVLEPANSAMSAIEPEHCEIAGIVTGVMRSV